MVRYSRLGAASISLVTSSGLRMVGRRSGILGRDILQHVGAFERLDEEETERGGSLRYGVGRQFLTLKQVSLELADMLGAEFLGRAV